jgi:8-oxo-dGTP pyrophosphatase MutT (NUDIX family)
MSWFALPVAIMLVIRKDNQVLLGRRINTGFKDGFFALPGGKHDGHETLSLTACREAQEELGIICVPYDLRFSTVIHVKGSFTPSELIYVTFEITQYQGEIINNEPHKCSELHFFPINQLPDKMTEVSRRCVQNTVNGISFDEMGWDKLVDPV